MPVGLVSLSQNSFAVLSLNVSAISAGCHIEQIPKLMTEALSC